MSTIRVVCISDTHGLHGDVKVPDGDILIHAGDFMNSGRSFAELADFFSWFERLPHRSKFFVAGNHDRAMDEFPILGMRERSTYLEDNSTTIDGLKIYGSPWQPEFNNWAFNLPRGEALARKWAAIPEDADILITHGPPRGILDQTAPGEAHLGCDDLADRLTHLTPRLHVFGHIHGSGGQRTSRNGTRFVNASVLDEQYRVKNEPVVVDLVRL